MSEPDEPPYVTAPDWISVKVTSPRGEFDGFVTAWKGERVCARWTEGIGEQYIQWLPASSVRRSTPVDPR